MWWYEFQHEITTRWWVRYLHLRSLLPCSCVLVTSNRCHVQVSGIRCKCIRVCVCACVSLYGRACVCSHVFVASSCSPCVRRCSWTLSPYSIKHVSPSTEATVPNVTHGWTPSCSARVDGTREGCVSNIHVECDYLHHSLSYSLNICHWQPHSLHFIPLWFSLHIE